MYRPRRLNIQHLVSWDDVLRIRCIAGRPPDVPKARAVLRSHLSANAQFIGLLRHLAVLDCSELRTNEAFFTELHIRYGFQLCAQEAVLFAAAHGSS